MKNISLKNKILLSVSSLIICISIFVSIFFPKMEEKMLTKEYNSTVNNLSKDYLSMANQ
mgnify:CR=1 FL=1